MSSAWLTAERNPEGSLAGQRRPVRLHLVYIAVFPRGVLNRKKKKVFRFPKKARGHSMCSTMVGGGWRLAVGNWRLVAVGGGWQRLVAGGWWLEAVGSWRLVAAGGWRRLVAGGWWRLVVGGWWRLAVDGSWRLAVGGPLGRSLRAVLSKKKKKSRPLRTPLVFPLGTLRIVLTVSDSFGRMQRSVEHFRRLWGIAASCRV